MKTNFVADWEQLKKGFDTAAKAVQNPNDAERAFLAVMAKPTGLTPTLKDVDSAFAKGYRKPANEALLKFYAKREPLALLLAKVMPKLDDDQLLQAAMKMNSGLPALEKSIQAKLKELQDEKAGAAGASDWNLLLLFETDLKKNIDTLTKDLKAGALPAIEKKHNVLKLPATAVKHMDAYSKAAARLEAKDALAALKAFVAAAQACANDCDKVLAKEKDADYTKAVQRFAKDLRTLCTARVSVQQKKLEEHLKA
jgi:hypothetical protein